MSRRSTLAQSLMLLVGVAVPQLLTAESVAEGGQRFDVSLEAELRERDAEAADLFLAANSARAAGGHARASALYGEVATRVPAFSHALRRQGTEELELGHRERGLELLRAALKVEEIAPNLSALAIGLATPTAAGPASTTEAKEAVRLARRAIASDSKYYLSYLALAQAALAVDSLSDLEDAVLGLRRTGPNEISTRYLTAIATASRGDVDGALVELQRARELGMSEEAFQQIKADIESGRPLIARFGWPVLVALAGWLGVLALLFLVGTALSRSTLRATERCAQGDASALLSLGSRLRGLYRGVIGATSTYFWISVPLLLITLLGLGAGVVYFGLEKPDEAPIRILGAIAAVSLISAGAIIQSLWALRNWKPEDPGRRLLLEENPAFGAVLTEVAERVGTRRVDSVFMTPGTDFAVVERGELATKLRDRGERCLILGVGVLDGMDQGAFRSVLAHEYGHFSNRDTAGGRFALAARASLHEMIRQIVVGRVATWYNPAWWFLRGFYAVFLRITQGASRLQEYLADRWAAVTYGAAAFERGLTHVIERSVRFHALAEASLSEVIEKELPLENLYEHRPTAAPLEEQLAEATRAALNAEPSTFDSHPTPARRFAWVRAVAGTERPSATDSDPAWLLFTDREALERSMTEQIKSNLWMNQGVEIPAAV